MLRYAGYAALALALAIVLFHYSPLSTEGIAAEVAAMESSITKHADQLVAGSQSQNAFIAAAAAHAAEPLALKERTKTADCEMAGPLPDPNCSPGAVFPEATPAVICVKGYTKTVRSVSVSVKKAVYAEYGIPYPQPAGSYEADHVIPLELGGSNDIANLFPEAAEPTPGFHEKDLVENYLHNEVCAGDLSLAYAQQQIATDWLVVWDALTPEEISFLKSQY